MQLIISNAPFNLMQSIKDLLIKSEDDKEEKKGDERPSWVNEILEALKPKQEDKKEEEEVKKIPTPPAPKTVEEEEEEEEQEQPKESLGKKVWGFLM